MDWTEARWQAAWRGVENESYVWSDAYDAHCFDPLPERHHTLLGKRSSKSLPLDEILWGQEPGQYMTQCPCHEDDSASLRVTLTEDLRPIVHCFAGCDWRDVKDYIRKHS